ncbi:hypothetical protein [Paraburkholderia sp. RAU2J]|uniref:hypothetical protein n=1 Tax=Paraburkholderia sp. RAU2J TaxID=1938810 RepID=UPI001F542D49|nr:hypothetical protein [Paraburkholderia sp. RAU2J]
MAVATANSILVVSFCRERLAVHGDPFKETLEAGETGPASGTRRQLNRFAGPRPADRAAERDGHGVCESAATHADAAWQRHRGGPRRFAGSNSVLDIQTRQLSANVQLLHALGGGWSSDELAQVAATLALVATTMAQVAN